jgi:hypothetical protein
VVAPQRSVSQKFISNDYNKSLYFSKINNIKLSELAMKACFKLITLHDSQTCAADDGKFYPLNIAPNLTFKDSTFQPQAVFTCFT